MLFRNLTAIFIFFNIHYLFAQDSTLLICGPMLGYVQHREALIWLETTPAVKKIQIKYFQEEAPASINTITYDGRLGERYNPVKIILPFLDMNTRYQYEIYLNDKKQVFTFPLTFKTKMVWEFRQPAPDFSFLFGSCAYINDALYDRPGEPYGRDPGIFDTMACVPSDFMIWLGDNMYTREADNTSRSGLYYRYTHDRKIPQLRRLLASRPNYATWDDHDYGPNDIGSCYELKDVSLQAFKDFWGNETYGESDNPGVYTHFNYIDCDFFLTDDRFYRSDDKMNDSSAAKHYLGNRQLEWLENSLLYSKATFKFICSGSQVLNPLNDFESWRHYQKEFDGLLKFIRENKINGVVFLSGDRHISEIIKVQPDGFYPLFDITGSAFTSRFNPKFTQGKEANNAFRVVPKAVLDQNFIKITVTGARNNRIASVSAITVDNMQAWNYEIHQSDITYK
ncbi:MAG: alkaline phosphatase family protein [Chitinophagales bacterium]|nr:alkaline phosphatase family protein [Chitinophagales bacterium]